jgi:hypothetical protein
LIDPSPAGIPQATVLPFRPTRAAADIAVEAYNDARDECGRDRTRVDDGHRCWEIRIVLSDMTHIRADLFVAPKHRGYVPQKSWLSIASRPR